MISLQIFLGGTLTLVFGFWLPFFAILYLLSQDKEIINALKEIRNQPVNCDSTGESEEEQVKTNVAQSDEKKFLNPTEIVEHPAMYAANYITNKEYRDRALKAIYAAGGDKSELDKIHSGIIQIIDSQKEAQNGIQRH